MGYIIYFFHLSFKKNKIHASENGQYERNWGPKLQVQCVINEFVHVTNKKHAITKTCSCYKHEACYNKAEVYVEIYINILDKGHTNHRNTRILPKYWNTREKYRYTCERHLLKTPILALINQLSNIMST